MAFLEKTGGNLTFAQLNFKTGTMEEAVLRTDPDSGEITKTKKEHAGISGKVKAFSFKEKKYEDEKYIQALIQFDDAFAISFSVGSKAKPNFGAAHLLGILRNADYSQDLTLRIGMAQAGDKIGDRIVDRDFVWTSVKQGEEKVQRHYGNSRKNDDGEMIDALPKAIEEKRDEDGKLVWADWTDVYAWIMKTLAEIRDAVTAQNPDAKPAEKPAEKPAPKTKGKGGNKNTEPFPDDDIPM